MNIAVNNVYIPDFENMRFVKKNVGIDNGYIAEVSDNTIEADQTIDGQKGYLTPGFIDCHCHIESSHLLPSCFGNEIVKHGTLHAVCDCHEIANVKGRKGLEFFIKEAKNSYCNLKFSVPSCVPATDFATSGGSIDTEDVEYFLNLDEVVALGELMNVPGIINREKKFMDMIKAAKKHKKRINGHAPNLSGEMLSKYISAGVEDDHESETYKELKEKINKGLYVFIREGSAEKTDDNAYKIIEEYPDRVMFCSDDKTAGDIIGYGHMDYNFKKALSLGIKPILALKAAAYNGLKYYGLDEFSEIKEGFKAHLILFDNEFNIKNIIINGETAAYKHTNANVPQEFLNSINTVYIDSVPPITNKEFCIGVKSGSLITEKINVDKDLPEYYLEKDLLKMCVFERYGHNNKSACRISGFGFKKGAIASSLSHDCHNIIAVGTSDNAIKTVVNEIIKRQGGIALFDGSNIHFLELRVGGIVSMKNAEEVSKQVEHLKKQSIKMGSKIEDAFAALSFMALEVIPHIKLTDRGLFDVDKFSYI